MKTHLGVGSYYLSVPTVRPSFAAHPTTSPDERVSLSFAAIIKDTRTLEIAPGIQHSGMASDRERALQLNPMLTAPAAGSRNRAAQVELSPWTANPALQ